MSRPVSPTMVDLSDASNIVTARHELHRATDFGGEAELAAWARKWGESAMTAADRAQHVIEEEWGVPTRLVDGQSDLETARQELGKDDPDLPKVRRLTERAARHLEQLKQSYDL